MNTVDELSKNSGKTAIKRYSFSRPVTFLLENNLLNLETSFFDFGCGKGDDVKLLKKQGFICSGWDPISFQDEKKIKADVVNVGYVINVIPDINERTKVLKDAWKLSNKVLCVSARLNNELSLLINKNKYLDGYVTEKETFQKFYDHFELKLFIESTLDVKAIAAGPGVYFIFKDEHLESQYKLNKYKSYIHIPKSLKVEVLYEENKELFENLKEYILQKGRLPKTNEIFDDNRLVEKFKSYKSALNILNRIYPKLDIKEIGGKRREDYLLFISLEAFNGRSRLNTLPIETQNDIKEFFTNYKTAKKESDKLLFSIGDPYVIRDKISKSKIGKKTQEALYVHIKAIDKLDITLRLYEGISRQYLGQPEGNIIKFPYEKKSISYHNYPDFDKNPHPELKTVNKIDLLNFKIIDKDYSSRSNPPILHRKELFIDKSDKNYQKFFKLTKQEEEAGLYTDITRIGTKKYWEELLSKNNYEIKNHKLVSK
jgi:DNA phosphorothioation-associated putative methyltransferase